MGISMSLFQSLGLTGIKSLSADKVFDKYFPSNKIRNFEEFHINFLKLCSDVNSVMLGKHYKPPSDTDIEECFTKWSKLEGNVEKKVQRKKLVLDLLTKNVNEIQTGNTIIMTGLVVPPTLMMLKKSSQNVPQLKRFRLDLVPDVIFVPTFTIAALFSVKALQLKLGNK